MKIVHTEASCGWGGQEIRILEESRGMIAKGHEIMLLCPSEARIFSEAQHRGIPVQALPIGRKKLRGVLAMRHWLQANPVDVINTHSSTDTWLTALARITLPKAPPLVRTRHISAPIPHNYATHWLYTTASAHVVTTGEKLRQTLITENGYPAEHLTSVPTGIDTTRFYPGDKEVARRLVGLPTSGRYIGIVATLRSWKGHRYLIEAYRNLRSEFTDLRLVIVGDGPQHEALMALIAEWGLQDSVLLAGLQAKPEEWMRAFDIFCLPSYANEGVPQALLQAMLSGLPIVSTPVGAIQEAIESDVTGLIVQPQNVDAITTAIRQLLQDQLLATKLAEQALLRARERYAFEGMIEKMERIFLQAIRGE